MATPIILLSGDAYRSSEISWCISTFSRGVRRSVQGAVARPRRLSPLTQVTQTELISQRADTRKEVERSVDIGWLHKVKESCLERIGEAVEKKLYRPIRNPLMMRDSYLSPASNRVRSSPRKTLLFHSRFAFHDRQRTEPQTPNFAVSEWMRNAGKVIIATQAIEQSLILTGDEMILI